MILSLRDQNLAEADQARLAKYHVPVMIAPVMIAEQKSYDNIVIGQADGYILTSQQAADALPQQGANKGSDSAQDDLYARPVFTVGRASAASARQKGYYNVYHGPSDGRALADMIATHPAAKGRHLCWLRAVKISFDIAGALHEMGQDITEAIIYEMVPAAALADDVCHALATAQITGIMALSQAQLGQFEDLLHHHKLWQACHNIDLYVVSEAVGNAARKSGWSSVWQARRKRAVSVQALVRWRHKQIGQKT